MDSSQAKERWWLEGEEWCLLCMQRYVYEIECRCAWCDRELCPSCVVRVREELVCFDCAPPQEER